MAVVAYHCDECDFTYDLTCAPDASAECVAWAGDLAALLVAEPEDAVRRRPRPEVWSALEYGCHVRDVLLVQRDRVLLVRREDDPAPPPMGRDERVFHDGYAEQHPADVARQLVDAASLFARDLDRLDRASWQRGIVYNYPPPPRRRTLEWVAVHTVHELRHHLQDARASATGERESTHG